MSSRSRRSKRAQVVGGVLAGAFALAGSLVDAPSAHADILVIAPHPDDDIITSAGVIYRARHASPPVTVWVLYMTNGDIHPSGTAWGLQREAEAVEGQALLGVDEDHLIFLGYPDGSLQNMRLNYAAQGNQFLPARCVPSAPQCAPSCIEGMPGCDKAACPGRCELTEHQIGTTYAEHGLGRHDYHSHVYGVAASNNGYNVIHDIDHVLRTYLPSDIFVVNQNDQHPDHSTTHEFLMDALALAVGPAYNPTVHRTIVWNNRYAWPPAPDPTTFFPPTLTVAERGYGTEYPWAERESLDVPLPMQVLDFALNLKARAIDSHETQGGFTGMRDMGQISSFVHKDEFFWPGRATGSNRPPVPNAGLDQGADVGATVTLDGSGSFDLNQDAVTYQWRQSDGPAVTLSSLTSAQPTFAVTAAHDDAWLAFELKVSDGVSTSVADAVSVRVGTAPPTPADGGTPPVDSGEDAGAPPEDAGVLPDDSGAAPVDSAAPPIDAEGTSVESGTPSEDAGTPFADAAGEPADAGEAFDASPLPDAAIEMDADTGYDAGAVEASIDRPDSGVSLADARRPLLGDDEEDDNEWPQDAGSAGRSKGNQSGCALGASSSDSNVSTFLLVLGIGTSLFRRRARTALEKTS